MFFIRILPSGKTDAARGPRVKNLYFSRGADQRPALSKPRSAMRSRTTKYAPASQFALNCKKAAQKSGFPFACARLFLSPTKRARFDPTENSFGGDPTLRRFAGTPTEGLFRASHLNESVRPFGVIWRTTLSAPLFRLVTYDQVRASPKKGCFRVLHPNGDVQRIR